MNKILIASVALLGFAGVAAAQQAPELYGTNYSASVLDAQAANDAGVRTAVVTSQQSVSAPRSDATVNINQTENYSGR